MMPLDLGHNKENLDSQGNEVTTSTSKGKGVQRSEENLTNIVCSSNKQKISASSFYSSRDDTTHPFTSVTNFKPDDQVFFNPNVDDNHGEETEEDDVDEEIAELALKNPAKFAQVMATEVSL